MAKAQRQTSRNDNPIAARRPKGKPVVAAKGKARGKAQRQPSRFRKITRAMMLLVLMVAIGFFGMLVIDLGGDAIARMRVGSVTVAELWGKLSDRLLDRDVPVINAKPAPRPSTNPMPAPPPRAATGPVATTTPTAANARAPLPAPSVRDYVDHVETKPDSQTELARRRLDALMGRL